MPVDPGPGYRAKTRKQREKERRDQRLAEIWAKEHNTPPAVVALNPPKPPKPRFGKTFADQPGVHYHVPVKGGGTVVALPRPPTGKEVSRAQERELRRRHELARLAQAPSAAGRKAEAKLAQTMTPERRRQYQEDIEPITETAEDLIAGTWAGENLLAAPGERLRPPRRPPRFGDQPGVSYDGQRPVTLSAYDRYLLAIGAPVSRDARNALAATMTEDRRQQIERMMLPDWMFKFAGGEKADVVGDIVGAGAEGVSDALRRVAPTVGMAAQRVPLPTGIGVVRRAVQEAAREVPDIDPTWAQKETERLIGLSKYVPDVPLGAPAWAVGNAVKGIKHVPGVGLVADQVGGAAAGILPGESEKRIAQAYEVSTSGVSLSSVLQGDNAFSRDTRNMIASFPVSMAMTFNAIKKDMAEGTLTNTTNLAIEQGTEYVHMLEEITPGIMPLEFYKAVASGNMDVATEIISRDPGRAKERWEENPVVSFLTAFSTIAGAARVASVMGLMRTMAKANPTLPTSTLVYRAVRESYNPGREAGFGREGGIGPRMWVTGEDGNVIVPAKRQWFRSPAARQVQRYTDKWQGLRPSEKAFSQARRAAAEAGRIETAKWERVRAEALEQVRVIQKFLNNGAVRTNVGATLGKRVANIEREIREAALFVGAHGPQGGERQTLLAAIDELSDIRDQGRKDIPGLDTVQIDRAVAVLRKKMVDAGLYPDQNQGLWADLRNWWAEIGRDPGEIESGIETLSIAAANWGRLTGLDPTEFLSHDRGLAIDGFTGDLPDDYTRILYQQAAGYHPLMARGEDWGMEPGKRVIVTTRSGEPEEATVVDTDPEFVGEGNVGVRFGDETEVTVFPQSAVSGFAEAPSAEAPVFHSELYRKLDEGLKDVDTFDNVKRLVKGTSPEELRVTGMDRLIREMDEALEDAKDNKREWKQINTVEKAYLLNIVRNGFSLHEILLRPDLTLRPERQTRYGGHLNDGAGLGYGVMEGVTTRNADPGYREIVIAQGGDPVYDSHHWGGIKNPLMHIRFREEPDTKSIHVSEAQSDAVNDYRKWEGDRKKTLKKLGYEDGADPDAVLAERMAEAERLRAETRNRALVAMGMDPMSPEARALVERAGPTQSLAVVQRELVENRFHDLRRQESGQESERGGPRTPEEEAAWDKFWKNMDKWDWSEAGQRNKDAKRIESAITGELNRLIGYIELEKDNWFSIQDLASDRHPWLPPFLGQERWMNIAIRRLAAYAARNGFEKISWDTGKVHSIRYSREAQDLLERMSREKTGEPVPVEPEPSNLTDLEEEELPLSDEEVELLSPEEIPELGGDAADVLGPRPRRLSLTPEEINGFDLRKAMEEEYAAKLAAWEADPEGYPRPRPPNLRHFVLYDEKWRRAAEKELGEVTPTTRRGQYSSEHSADLVESGDMRGEGIDTPEGEVEAMEATISPEKREALKQGETQRLWQRGMEEGESPRGATVWLASENGRRTVYLAKTGDVSTVIHELVGHATDHMRGQYPELWGGVEKSMGKAYANWRAPEFERYARWVERYHRENKVPDESLRPFFSMLKDWMTQVYEGIKALGGRPVPAAVRKQLDAFYGITEKPLSRKQQKRLAEAEKEARYLEANGSDYEASVANQMLEELRQDFYRQNRTSVFSAKEQDQLERLGQLLQQRYDAIVRDGGKDINLSHIEFTRNLEAAQEALDAAMGDPDADLTGYEKAMKRKYKEGWRRRKGAKEAGTPSDVDRLLNKNIARLRKATEGGITENPEYAEAMAAVQTLSTMARDLHRDILREGLKPEEQEMVEFMFDMREDVLHNRWRDMGLMPYGLEKAQAYIPHLSIYQELIRRAQAVRAPIGKTQQIALDPRVDRMASRKGPNRAILWQTGMVRMDPTVLINVIEARIRLAETKAKRKLLWDMGTDVRPSNMDSLRAQGGDWFLIREKGADIPESMKAQLRMTEEEWDQRLAAGEDYESSLEYQEGLDKAMAEVFGTYAKRPDEMPQEWIDAWERDEMNFRAVREVLAAKVIPEVHYSAPSGAISSAVGIANLLNRLNVIYQYPLGYITGNAANNLAMLAFTNPLSNIPALIRQIKPRAGEVRRAINLEMGHAQAQAGFAEFYARPKRRIQRVERGMQAGMERFAGGLSAVGDSPFRRAAWEGYARRHGFASDADLRWLLGISKRRPEKFSHMNDEQRVALLNTIRQQAREDMIDFDTLSAREKATVSRWLFLWPLTKGMAKWPVTFTANHPLAMAGLATFADEEDQRQVLGDLPEYDQRALRDLNVLPAGVGKTINPSTVNPLGIGEKVVGANDAITRVFQGDVSGLGEYVLENTLPALAIWFQPGRGLDDVARNMLPGGGYIWPSGDKRYPERTRSNYWWLRNLRFWPETTSTENIEEAGEREQSELTGVSSTQRKEEKIFKKTVQRFLNENGGFFGDVARMNQSMEMYWEYQKRRESGVPIEEKIKLQTEILEKYGRTVEDRAWFEGNPEAYSKALADSIGTDHAAFTGWARDYGYLPKK